jgi:hypothetical protein
MQRRQLWHRQMEARAPRPCEQDIQGLEMWGQQMQEPQSQEQESQEQE